MLPQFKKNANIGVWVGLLLQISGQVLTRNWQDAAGNFGIAVLAIGVAVFIWGCGQYAKGKGYSAWFGALGLLNIIGLVVLVLFPDRYKNGRKIDCLLFVVFVFGSAAIISWSMFDHNLYPEPRPLVSPEAALQLEPGMTAEAVVRRAGTLGRHEFTQLGRDGSIYQLIAIEVDFEHGHGKWVYLLFKDQRLWKRLIKVPCVASSNPWDACDVSSKDIHATVDSLKDVEAIVNMVTNESVDVGADGLTTAIADYRIFVAHMHEAGPQIPTVVLVGITVALPLAVTLGNIVRDIVWYRRNSRFAQKFDGFRVSIGMQVVEAERLYGAPRAVYPLASNRSLHLFGGDDVENPFVDRPAVKYSWVAVLSDNGRVIGVNSHLFFSKAWRNPPSL